MERRSTSIYNPVFVDSAIVSMSFRIGFAACCRRRLELEIGFSACCEARLGLAVLMLLVFRGYAPSLCNKGVAQNKATAYGEASLASQQAAKPMRKYKLQSTNFQGPTSKYKLQGTNFKAQT